MNKFLTFLGLAATLVFFASASSCSDQPQANLDSAVQSTAQIEDGSDVNNVASESQTTTDPATMSEADKEWEKVKKKAMKSGKVKIETPMGDMVVMLYDETPLHKENFLKLAYEGYYDGLLWHRIIQGFMCQGGDPNSRDAAPGQRLGTGGPKYKIPAEIKTGLVHKKGALAAARQGGPVNPEKKSSGSQFYIVQGRPTPRAAFEQRVLQGNAARGEGQKVEYTEEQLTHYEQVGGTPMLDGEYTVFGEVIEGLEVIDKLAAVKTAQGDRPVEDVTMKMTVVGL